MMEPAPAAVDALRRLSPSVKGADAQFTVRVEREETIPLLADAVAQNGGRLLALVPRRSTLEDYFIQVIEGSN